MNYRYVLSGSCCDCVNSSRVLVNSSTRDDAMATVLERNSVRRNLVLAKFRCFPIDAEDLKLMTYGFVLMRFPTAIFDHIDPKLPATDEAGGTFVYSVYCHADDISQIKAAANESTMRRNPLDIAAARSQIMKVNLGDIKDSTPPVSFK